MARHPIPEPKDTRDLDIDEFTAGVRGTKDSPAYTKLMGRKVFDRHVAEGRDIIAGKLVPKKGAEFVYLYAALHEAVYGTLPMELRKDVGKASAAAANMLRNEFSGNAKLMLNFVRWTWSRENQELKRRSPENTFRIGWRLQFGYRMLTDFRIAIGRNGKIGQAK